MNFFDVQSLAASMYTPGQGSPSTVVPAGPVTPDEPVEPQPIENLDQKLDELYSE